MAALTREEPARMMRGMSFRFRHVIWDWNGTLFDDAWLCRGIINGLLRRRGLPELTAARYAEIFDFPVRDYYARAGFDFSKESFEALGAEFMADYERRRCECRLRPDAMDALRRLAESGLEQSVLSAYRHDTLETLLEHHGVRPFLTHVIGASNIYAAGKEEEARRLLAALDAEPDAVVLIGDTVHDFDVARSIGVHCRLLFSGHQSRQRLARCGPTVYDSLADLLPSLL
jgi:phosphoglycolate phosphatase